MQINGRLQLQLTVDSKEYNLTGSVELRSTEIEQKAEEMAERIMQRVRQRSGLKHTAKSIGSYQSQNYFQVNKAVQSDEKQVADKAVSMNIREFIDPNPPSNIFVQTTYQQSKPPGIQTNFEKPEPLQLPIQESIIQSQQSPGSFVTPIKSKSQQNIAQPRKDSTQKKQQKYFLPEQKKRDGIHLIKMMYLILQSSDNVHDLVKKSQTTIIPQRPNRVETHKKTSPVRPVTRNIVSPKQTEERVVVSPKKQPISQSKLHKDDVVSQLLSSLRQAKKLKDEFTRQYL